MLTPCAPTDRQLTASASDAPKSDTASRPSAHVIEFYVPPTFQLPTRRWLPPEARGKLIEFPKRGRRKSASNSRVSLEIRS